MTIDRFCLRESLRRPTVWTTARFCASLLLVGLVAQGVAAAGADDRLAAGDPTPSVAFEDIEGELSSTDAYRDWVQVITFADRESSERMKAWMADAQVNATRSHPELPVAYLTFADVGGVPRFLRGMVSGFLRSSFESSNEELVESYRKVGIEVDASKVAFRFTPDWDGKHLKNFGLENATKYHCWIAHRGKIVAVLHESTPDITGRYQKAFDQLAAPEKTAAH